MDELNPLFQQLVFQLYCIAYGINLREMSSHEYDVIMKIHYRRFKKQRKSLMDSYLYKDD